MVDYDDDDGVDAACCRAPTVENTSDRTIPSVHTRSLDKTALWGKHGVKEA